ncbi:chymotrypsinogen B-like isoform X2 [Convolutriloba macropyga]|uniref:chymotrypsinogen B-like isoform X2 n=1 Tax=Convolutriloba macropyga TaxID=536237 RepID=UPI003F51C460
MTNLTLFSLLITAVLQFCRGFQFIREEHDQTIYERRSEQKSRLRSALTFNILGGHLSPRRKFYVQVYTWRSRTYTEACGGTIVSSQWVVTAAHCVYGAKTKDVYIYVGDFAQPVPVNNRQNISKIFEYQEFEEASLKNDIAMIKVKNFQFPESSILPLCVDVEPDYCSLLATCGMGRTSREHIFLSVVLKELYLLEESSILPAKNKSFTRVPKYRHGRTFGGDSGNPLYTFKHSSPNSDVSYVNNEPRCLYGVASNNPYWRAWFGLFYAEQDLTPYSTTDSLQPTSSVQSTSSHWPPYHKSFCNS